MRSRTASIIFASLAATSAFAQVPNPTQSNQQPVTMPDVVFRTTVTSRTIKAINYHHRQGATPVGFVGTALMNMAKGEARVDSKTGATKIDVNFDKLGPAQVHGEEFLTYVLWAITPEGRAENLGEVMVEGDSAKLQTSTELQAFGMVVTAEPYWAVTQPSDAVVMEAVVKQGTTGTITPIEAKYELLQRGSYLARLPAADRAILKQKNDVPLDLKEARHAMAIARSSGADSYAGDTMKKAAIDLQNAEGFWQSRKDKKRVQTLARNVTQLAEDARIITAKRLEEEQLANERRVAEAKVAQAQSDAERQTRQREVAEMDKRLAMEREEQAQLLARQEEARRRRAERDRAEAESQRKLFEDQAVTARLAAETARAEALKEQQRATEETASIRRETEALRAQAEEERQRLQAETDRARQAAASAEERSRQAAASAEERSRQAEADRLRARDELRQQLNIVLQTRDSARGLIVNMSDVLFDTAQATLRPGAREKLAKVAGIVLAHPDLKLQIEGHTDSVGDDAYNQRLSERRASTVSEFLIGQGVSSTAVTARGFGKTLPVASNASAGGRQQNRRVELVVTGESIKATATSAATDSP